MLWINVKGYGGQYRLSEKGDLMHGKRVVKSCNASNGKRYVTLWKNGVRKNYMLHNLYADTFELPVEDAMRILYEGYSNNPGAKNNVREWILLKIGECERESDKFNDEILYLRNFLRQLNEKK